MAAAVESESLPTAEGSEGETQKETRWLALESNPEVLSQYMAGLGLETEAGEGKVWRFEELLALDPPMNQALEPIDGPVYAVAFLFPITNATEARARDQVDALRATGNDKVPDNLFFMQQKIGNACGTFCVVHALANNLDKLPFREDSVLKSFVGRTRGLSPSERNDVLEEDKGFHAAHDEAAAEGQTDVPPLDAQLALHFITFLHHQGQLFEMDGRKPFPILHGPTSQDSLLLDTVPVLKTYMDLAPGELNFVTFALTKADKPAAK